MKKKIKLPLHRKYRPKNFNQIFGNKELIDSIKSFIDREDKPTTYLLGGPRGTGKSTLSRIMANELGEFENKQEYSLGVTEYNISFTGTKEAAKEIDRQARFTPLNGKAKVFILNEIQGANAYFQNTLLDVTEEPPSNIYFIFCTTDPQKLLKPLVSRCSLKNQPTRLLNRQEISKLIKYVLRKEKKEFPKEAINKIAKVSGGSPREALVALGDVINIKNKRKLLNAIGQLETEETQLNELCQAMLQGKSWKIISSLVKGINGEPESIRYGILSYMEKVLLNKINAERALEIGQLFEESFIYSGKFGFIAACYLSTLNE